MDLEAEYNNRARVPESAAIIAGWARDAAAWRAAHPAAEYALPYGPGERERLDLFWPDAGRRAPIALFIHGGYWQALDRSFFSHMARGANAHGVALAIPSYDLCPAVTLRQILGQMRAAAAFLHRRHGRPLLASGHSAGGHLTALLLATDWPALDPALPPRLVAAGLPVSGLFDLAPLLSTSLAGGLRLDTAEAAALSPRLLPPPPALPAGALHVAVGGAESGEFLRQSRDFAAAWGGGFEAIPGLNHFTVLEPLADPAGSLALRLAAMARAAAAG